MRSLRGQLGHVSLSSSVTVTVVSSRHKILNINTQPRHNCQNLCVCVHEVSLHVCAAQSEWLPIFVKRCILLEFSSKTSFRALKYNPSGIHSGLLCLRLCLASFCASFFGVCSISIAPLLFGFSFFFSLLVSPEGLKNPLLQATQVEWRLFCCLGLGVYYVR